MLISLFILFWRKSLFAIFVVSVFLTKSRGWQFWLQHHTPEGVEGYANMTMLVEAWITQQKRAGNALQRGQQKSFTADTGAEFPRRRPLLVWKQLRTRFKISLQVSMSLNIHFKPPIRRQTVESQTSIAAKHCIAEISVTNRGRLFIACCSAEKFQIFHSFQIHSDKWSFLQQICSFEVR